MGMNETALTPPPPNTHTPRNCFVLLSALLFDCSRTHVCEWAFNGMAKVRRRPSSSDVRTNPVFCYLGRLTRSHRWQGPPWPPP